MVGELLAQGVEWDACLQENEDTGKYDAGAQAMADKFGNLCDQDVDPYKAFVLTFYGQE